MTKILLLLSLFFSAYSYGQEPVLSGTINVSIKKGTLDCDLTLSEIPTINNYEILINSGLNIEYFRDNKNSKNINYDKKYDKKISEESFLYSFSSSNENKKFIPNEIQFKYTGKFPVIADTTLAYRKGDWKGNIAFNGTSLRMDGYQTNWYPVIYDIDKDKKYDVIKYNINVICDDCKTLYVNGNKPVNSSKQTFKSDLPTEVLLYIGDYDFYNINDTYFLNPDISETQMKDFANIIETFKTFYTRKLKIPYKGYINFIQTLPTTKNINNSFLFVTYPTIMNVGRGKYGMNFFVSDKNKYGKKSIAHELGHYYFGSGYKTFNSVIGAVIQEGFAEYLSFKASKEVLGYDFYNESLESTLSVFKNKKFFLPISQIREHKDFGNYYVYVYTYFPTILLAIEKEIGEDKMWIWMNKLLTSEAEFSNFDFLKFTLEKTINDNKLTNEIIEKYLTTEKSLDNALEKINQK